MSDQTLKMPRSSNLPSDSVIFHWFVQAELILCFMFDKVQAQCGIRLVTVGKEAHLLQYLSFQ